VTDRPAYADYDAPAKFSAIQAIIATRLREHPKAICSYSGGSDSDILIDLIERTRNMYNEQIFSLPKVKYVFFNTGLELKATKDHVKATAEKYGVEIVECKPKKNIVLATREYGVPFISKIISQRLERVQKKKLPLEIKEEFDSAEDKAAKRKELKERYPKSEEGINFLCSCNFEGELRTETQGSIASKPYLYEFMKENPPTFAISAKCCNYCKKQLAYQVQKDYEMIITGERCAEGGVRSMARPLYEENTGTMCFSQNAKGQYRLKPLYYVSDKDKEWYKRKYGIRYSDAYEVYGLTRTGCCGCSISSKAVNDLEKIRPYEPNVVKAAWAIFGDSYRYRQAYNEFKAKKSQCEGQLRFEDLADN